VSSSSKSNLQHVSPVEIRTFLKAEELSVSGWQQWRVLALGAEVEARATPVKYKSYSVRTHET
jgi:hypothetical protein